MGADKAALRLGPRTFLGHCLCAALAVHPRALVSVGAGPCAVASPAGLSEFPADRWRVVPDDPDAAGHGPIGGLVSAARVCRAPWLQALPCDCPLAPPALLRALAGRVAEAEAAGRVAVMPVGPAGFAEPLHAVYSAQALRSGAAEAMRGGSNRVAGRWIDEAGGALLVPWATELRDADPRGLAFLNANTPSGLCELRAAAAQ
eukprot:m51a1_g6591 putative molybdopterin-guanine dinucleotide biosynthesis protein (203) ;mRNA; r:250516-251124